MIVTLLTTLVVCSCGIILYRVWDARRQQGRVGELHRKCVFITGCDTGFGNGLARRLDSMGVPVFAGCFSEMGAKQLRAVTSGKLQTVLVDVTKEESVQEAYAFVNDNLPSGTGLWGLVNNAGCRGATGPVEFLKRQHFRDVFELNLYGMVEVTVTFLPLLKKEQGRIINTSSGTAVVPLLNMCPYLTSKHAVRGFTDVLRREKKQFGVKVASVLPGMFSTPITAQDGVDRQTRANWVTLPDDVREEYSEEFLDRMATLGRTGMEKSSTDVTPVIDAYEHALFAEHPYDEYYPGMELAGRLLNILPRAWFNYIMFSFFLTEKHVMKPTNHTRPVH